MTIMFSLGFRNAASTRMGMGRAAISRISKRRSGFGVVGQRETTEILVWLVSPKNFGGTLSEEGGAVNGRQTKAVGLVRG